MGIINVTPDSFSDGGQFATTQAAIDHARRLVDEGADILDVGGESTRPGATPVDAVEEMQRVLPVIEGIRKHNSSIPISIDTYKANVARAALDAGATMVNDVSAGRFDNAMFPLIRERRIPYILMHMQGEPRTMQAHPTYANVVSEVTAFLQESVTELGDTGATVYVDPGIGFGKTTQQNLELIRRLDSIATIAPVVLGISRKRFLTDITGATSIEERDVATMAVHALSGVPPPAVIRVHNVRAAVVLRAAGLVMSN